MSFCSVDESTGSDSTESEIICDPLVDQVLAAEGDDTRLESQGLERNVHRSLWGFGLNSFISNIVVAMWHVLDTVFIIHLFGRKAYYVESAIFLTSFPMYRGIPTSISSACMHFVKHALVHNRTVTANIYFSHTILMCTLFAILFALCFTPLSPQLSAALDGGRYTAQQEMGTMSTYISSSFVPILSLFTHAVDPILMLQGRHFLMAIKTIIFMTVAAILLTVFILFLHAHALSIEPSMYILYPLLSYCLSGIIIIIWMIALMARVKLYGIAYNNNLHLALHHFLPVNFGILKIIFLRSLPSITVHVLYGVLFMLTYNFYGNTYFDYESMVTGKLSFSIFARSTISFTIISAGFGNVVMYLIQLAHYARRYIRARSVMLWGALYATVFNAVMCAGFYFGADFLAKTLIMLPNTTYSDASDMLLNAAEFYAAITRALKLSALANAPSGLYIVVLSAMQASNYGLGALIMALVKVLSILTTLIILRYVQGPGSNYILAFAMGELAGFLLAIFGLIFQAKRFTLFSRADPIADLTVSKIDASHKKMRPLSGEPGAARPAKQENRGKPVKLPRAPKSPKQKEPKAPKPPRVKPEKVKKSKAIPSDNDGIMDSAVASDYNESPSRGSDTGSSVKTSSTKLGAPDVDDQTLDTVSANNIYASIDDLSRRPVTKALVRPSPRTMQPVMNTNLHICEARSISSSSESSIKNADIENDNTATPQLQEGTVGAGSPSEETNANDRLDKNTVVTPEVSSEANQSLMTPIIHLDFLQQGDGAQDD